MGCCAECFGDRQLKRVIAERSEGKGTCRYCRSEDVHLVSPQALQDLFEALVGIYRQGKNGKSLVEWFREDWSMFQREQMDNAHAKELLGDVLDNGDIVRQCFVVSQPGASDALGRWREFREELLCRNRFFLDNELDLNRLKELFDFLLAEEADNRQRFYRARVQSGTDPYPANEMGAPPASISKHGRANPAGIPYLYLASDPETVISEIRPNKGQFASVARFSIASDCRILDLREPKKTVSPFLFADEQEISRLREDIGFLELLGDELSRPVLEDSAQIDYLPSQYLCEFAKHCGFDGVFYKSSVGPGFNLAMFNPDSPQKDEIVDTYYVSAVNVEIERH